MYSLLYTIVYNAYIHMYANVHECMYINYMYLHMYSAL